MSEVPQRQEADVNLSNTSEPAATSLMLVHPDLARKLGLEEAVFVSQLDYWLRRSKNFRIEDGCRWIWNTVDQWLEQFCWMSRSKLERVIAKLQRLGVLLNQKFWKSQWNHTKWYRLDYQKLQEDYGWIPADKSQQKLPQSDATRTQVTNYSHVTEALQTEPVKLAEPITSNCEERSHQNDGFKYIDYKSEITSKNTHPEAGEECANAFEKKEPKTGGKQQSLALLAEKPEPIAQPKDPDQDQVFRPDVVRKTQKLQESDVTPRTHELLSNPVFVQWWVNRIEKSDFAQKLVKPPLAYVKGEIRSKPQTALDMWESFQLEMTSRVENVNLRQQNGISIMSQEYEEVCAIAPYSAITLQAVTPKLVANNELSEEEKQRLRQEATGGLSNRFKSFNRTTANNSTSNKLLTPEQFQKKKDEILRQFIDGNETSVVSPPETTTNQTDDYDEADFLGKPDPADFEAFWTDEE